MKNLKEIINAFIIQSGLDEKQYGPGGQVVKDYPKEYSDLKMKVSFGIGSPARVSWISYLTTEMTTSNGFYPVYLFYKKERKLILSYGISETKEAQSSWPEEITNNKIKIKDYLNKPPRYGNSFVFKAYSISVDDKEIKYFDKDNQSISADKLANDLEEILKYYKDIFSLEVKKEGTTIAQGDFYLEEHLEDFIIQNWDKTEFGNKYDLIYEAGDLISQQFQTNEVGTIDILTKDKITKNYVVIELKKGRTSDKVIGQIVRYMGWIEEHKNDKNVKGIIVASAYDKNLKYALKKVPNVEVFSYEVNFKLKEYKS